MAQEERIEYNFSESVKNKEAMSIINQMEYLTGMKAGNDIFAGAHELQFPHLLLREKFKADFVDVGLLLYVAGQALVASCQQHELQFQLLQPVQGGDGVEGDFPVEDDQPLGILARTDEEGNHALEGQLVSLGQGLCADVCAFLFEPGSGAYPHRYPADDGFYSLTGVFVEIYSGLEPQPPVGSCPADEPGKGVIGASFHAGCHGEQGALGDALWPEFGDEGLAAGDESAVGEDQGGSRGQLRENALFVYFDAQLLRPAADAVHDQGAGGDERQGQPSQEHRQPRGQHGHQGHLLEPLPVASSEGGENHESLPEFDDKTMSHVYNLDSYCAWVVIQLCGCFILLVSIFWVFSMWEV